MDKPTPLIKGRSCLNHGGDPKSAEARFGAPKDGWLDLSTGINPQAYPARDMDADVWARLPRADELGALADVAARAYGAPGGDVVCVAPGTQALIQWLPRLRELSSVAVCSPTYAEHARTWEAAGHKVKLINDIADLTGTEDVVVVVNPNNPDGRTIAPEHLLALAAQLAGRDGWLVVDEAFGDIAPELSVAAHAGASGLVVLRSFGKFFGLAGVRLGFALADVPLAQRLRTALGPWAVAGPAIVIGTRALRDDAWIEATRQNLLRDSRRLAAMLQDAGFEIIGGTGLFQLAAHENAPKIFERLARAGIWVRMFSGQPQWLRFGLPGCDAGWGRLEAALNGESEKA